ncbi:hypothetical protein ACVXHB_24620 [Escherichia coli]
MKSRAWRNRQRRRLSPAVTRLAKRNLRIASATIRRTGQSFVGNSLVVRLIDALSQLPAGYPAQSNRGASGIDGLLSTAAGVQRASGKPTLAIVAISPHFTISTRWRYCVRFLRRWY